MSTAGRTGGGGTCGKDDEGGRRGTGTADREHGEDHPLRPGVLEAEAHPNDVLVGDVLQHGVHLRGPQQQCVLTLRRQSAGTFLEITVATKPHVGWACATGRTHKCIQILERTEAVQKQIGSKFWGGGVWRASQ